MESILGTAPTAVLGWMVGWQEILVIVFVLLLLFGGKKLPELARGMGRGLRHFKEELHGVKKQIGDSTEVEIDTPVEDDYDTPADDDKDAEQPADEAKENEPQETKA